jgi:hypothetical protein
MFTTKCNDIIFNFLMLCHWFASQETLSIKLWTCLNSEKKTSLKKKTTKLKWVFKCDDFYFMLNFKIWQFVSEKMGIFWDNILFKFNLFHFGEIILHKERRC